MVGVCEGVYTRFIHQVYTVLDHIRRDEDQNDELKFDSHQQFGLKIFLFKLTTTACLPHLFTLCFCASWTSNDLFWDIYDSNHPKCFYRGLFDNIRVLPLLRMMKGNTRTQVNVGVR